MNQPVIISSFRGTFAYKLGWEEKGVLRISQQVPSKRRDASLTISTSKSQTIVPWTREKFISEDNHDGLPASLDLLKRLAELLQAGALKYSTRPWTPISLFHMFTITDLVTISYQDQSQRPIGTSQCVTIRIYPPAMPDKRPRLKLSWKYRLSGI